MPLPTAFTTSNSQIWTTPWPVIHALSPEFRFTLDAAACALSAKAPKYFTEDEDAFVKDWHQEAAGGDVWCNPPYGEYRGRRVGDWVEKGFRESLKGVTVVFLLPCNKQDQDWYHDIALPRATIRPVKGRIQFVDPVTGKPPMVWSDKRQEMVKNGNSQGSNIIIFGPSYYPCAPKSFVYSRA